MEKEKHRPRLMALCIVCLMFLFGGTSIGINLYEINIFAASAGRRHSEVEHGIHGEVDCSKQECTTSSKLMDRELSTPRVEVQGEGSKLYAVRDPAKSAKSQLPHLDANSR
jgi:hypothetical protein